MKDKVVITLLIVAILAAGVFLYKKEQSQTATPALTTSSVKVETFLGTLPCADCEGVKTTVILTYDKAGTGGTYLKKSVYVGAPSPSSYDEKGTWKIVKKNPKEMIYVLMAKPDQAEAYELTDSGHLHLLDQKMQPITAKNLNFILTRQLAR